MNIEGEVMDLEREWQKNNDPIFFLISGHYFVLVPILLLNITQQAIAIRQI
jgi:hypothetical protein